MESGFYKIREINIKNNKKDLKQKIHLILHNEIKFIIQLYKNKE